MKNTMQSSIKPQDNQPNVTPPIGGLAVRTDLRAGLAWDELDDQVKELWSSSTGTLSGLTDGTEASS